MSYRHRIEDKQKLKHVSHKLFVAVGNEMKVNGQCELDIDTEHLTTNFIIAFVGVQGMIRVELTLEREYWGQIMGIVKLRKTSASKSTNKLCEKETVPTRSEIIVKSVC